MTRERITTIVAGSLAGLLLFAWLLGPAWVYIVDEREYAVVLRFREPVAERTEPGLYVKSPFVEEVVRLPKTRQFWIAADSLDDVPTKEGNKINLVPWAIWRITGPKEFVSRFGTSIEPGEQRVSSTVRAAMRDIVTRTDLVSLVRSSQRKLEFSIGIEPGAEDLPAEAALPAAGDRFVGRTKILEEVQRESQTRLVDALRKSGGGADSPAFIEIVDIGIARIEFSALVQASAFLRQRTRMEALSARHINEGERQKQAILNATEAEVKRIQAEGQKEANILRGDADAYALKQYAAALKEMGEFYAFFRTLEGYKKSLGGQSQLILTTDNEYLQYLSRLPDAGATVPAKAPSDAVEPVGR